MDPDVIKCQLAPFAKVMENVAQRKEATTVTEGTSDNMSGILRLR